MAAATQTGVDNSEAFLKTVNDMGDQSDIAAVSNLLKAQNWQGVVDYAKTFQYYNYNKKPFTAADADVGLNPWMFVAIPDDYNDKDIKGSMVAIRPYSGVGFGVLDKGGIATMPSGDVLETDKASTDAGSPVGAPYTVPSMNGTKSSWYLSQTSTGKLGFFKGTTCHCVLAGTGTVWTRQNSDMKEPPLERSDGNLVTGASTSVTAGNDLVTTFANYAAQAWSVAETDLGNLVFRSQSTSGGTPIVIADGATGLLCNGTGAVFKPDDFKISWQGYIDYFWKEFTDLTGEGFGWVENLADISASWMEDAAMDTWDWINDTASDAWKAIDDSWDQVEKGIDDGIKDVGKALDVTKW
ncbi:hypothetical protein [Roseomonas genomospecies 6]|uniref:Uncharacterized protein n=1 Tax=Roseomonas genomospecies 6 TaxID=214106 RepID=A0A9W7KSP1_9PROT|nr:hypothetical protein [Roseomonas genomospecies 6]KAA0677938.1 hypothetical protein DS843_21625 [Roseomonas genomospecies 6]